MSDWTKMAGSEGTYKYYVLARGLFGRVGIRLLSPQAYRIRVEPIHNEDSYDKAVELHNKLSPSWRAPNEEQHRCSYVASSWGSARKAILQALEVIEPGVDKLVMNPDTPPNLRGPLVDYVMGPHSNYSDIQFNNVAPVYFEDDSSSDDEEEDYDEEYEEDEEDDEKDDDEEEPTVKSKESTSPDTLSLLRDISDKLRKILGD